MFAHHTDYYACIIIITTAECSHLIEGRLQFVPEYSSLDVLFNQRQISEGVAGQPLSSMTPECVRRLTRLCKQKHRIKLK